MLGETKNQMLEAKIHVKERKNAFDWLIVDWKELKKHSFEIISVKTHKTEKAREKPRKNP